MDKWVGPILCLVISLLRAVCRLLGLGTLHPQFRPRKVLFIELSEMGSAILACSAMLRAREAFAAQLFFLIFKENAESVYLTGLVPRENVITIRSNAFIPFVVDTVKALRRAWNERIDTVVDLELFSRFSSIIAGASPAMAIAAFHRYHMEGLYRGSFHTHHVMYNPYMHMARNYLALVYALMQGKSDEPLLKQVVPEDDIEYLKVRSTPAERQAVIDKLTSLKSDFDPWHGVVIMNPGASKFLPVRKWPIENYIELARRVKASTSATIVLVGVESDMPEAEAIHCAVGKERCVNFVGRTETLWEFVTLCNLSDVIVTNDSGPAHFAALTDIRIVVFFGPETPALYAPVSKKCTALYAGLACSPCVSAYNHRKTSCRDNQCLKAIPVREVLPHVLSALDKSGKDS